MTSTKGDRIRHARELRQETREQVATATGVNAKTIARIERGEVTNSASITVLERYLELTPVQPAAQPTATLDQRTIDDVLDNVSFLELLAAVARRYARATGTHQVPQPESGNRYKIFTEDVPSPEHPATDHPEAGESGKLP